MNFVCVAINSIHICLFILSYYIVSLLDLVYFLFSYVNIRMIETFL